MGKATAWLLLTTTRSVLNLGLVASVHGKSSAFRAGRLTYTGQGWNSGIIHASATPQLV